MNEELKVIRQQIIWLISIPLANCVPSSPKRPASGKTLRWPRAWQNWNTVMAGQMGDETRDYLVFCLTFLP